MSIFCQCCFTKCEDQVNMSSPVYNQGILHVYEEMLQYSTGIQLLRDNNIHYICDICIGKLQQCCIFKNQVQETQYRLWMIYTKTEPDDDFGNNLICDTKSIKKSKCENKKSRSKSNNNKKRKCHTKSCINKEDSEHNFDDNSIGSFESYSFDLESDGPKKKTRKKLIRFQELLEDQEVTLLQCKKCTASFENNEEYDIHTKSCNISSICPQCGKIFHAKRYFAAHLKSHSNAPTIKYRYSCKQCPEKFTYFFAKKDHMVKAHGAKLQVYSCNLCPRTFKRFGAQRIHIRKDHNKEINFSCSECNKDFFSKSSFEQHMLIHTGKRNFECELCHKRFARKKTLKEHLKIHYHIKDYKCNICGKAFVQKVALNQHLKTHK